MVSVLICRARKHGMNSRGELIPKKLFPCAECGKVLTSGIKLRSHVEVVHQERLLMFRTKNSYPDPRAEQPAGPVIIKFRYLFPCPNLDRKSVV